MRGRFHGEPLACTAARFDERADVYDDDRFHRWLATEVTARAGSLRGRVLDVGAGTGLVSRGRRPPEGLTVLLDLSPGMLRTARQRDVRALPVRGDAHSLPFAPGSFDTVVCVAADAFLDLAVFAGEVTRVLRPRGELVMTAWADAPSEPSDVAADAGRVLVAGGLGVETADVLTSSEVAHGLERRCVLLTAVAFASPDAR